MGLTPQIRGRVPPFLNNNFGLDNGTVVFANVTNFLNAAASSFSIRLETLTPVSARRPWWVYSGNYKIRTNLTLELGLRYDWNMSPTERYNRFANFIPGSSSLVQVNNGTAPIYKTNNKNIQPRLGSHGTHSRTARLRSVRIRVLVDQPVTNLVSGTVGSNPPFANPVSFSSSLLNPTIPLGVLLGHRLPCLVLTWSIRISITLTSSRGTLTSKGISVRVSESPQDTLDPKGRTCE